MEVPTTSLTFSPILPYFIDYCNKKEEKITRIIFVSAETKLLILHM